MASLRARSNVWVGVGAYASVVNNRPDGEVPGQLPNAAAEARTSAT